MMRRVICFLLVLVLCLSMATTAFAATKSPANKAPVTSSGSNPRTGDIIMMWAIIMILALLALCVMFVLYRKIFRH